MIYSAVCLYDDDIICGALQPQIDQIKANINKDRNLLLPYHLLFFQWVLKKC